MSWDGEAYQRRFDELAAQGVDVHGEAMLVLSFGPRSVLDAGCGSGRVALELARRGVEVVGVDTHRSMLATARARSASGPEGVPPAWVEADLAGLELGRTFDVVVMAGNVVLFTPPGTEAAVVAGCAAHVAPGGVLVAGFELGRSYALADYDRHCHDAGLELVERWSTWDRAPFPAGGGYAVSVHRPRLTRSSPPAGDAGAGQPN